MGRDITLAIDDGLINIRVGAIIMKDGKVLMNRSTKGGHMYTIGGRIQFGESSEEAVLREVREETGVELEIDSLGFVQENMFEDDVHNFGKRLVYELGFYYFMKTPEDFEPAWEIHREGNTSEKLIWMDIDTEEAYFPQFFRTELKAEALKNHKGVKHIFTDGRKQA